MPRPNLTFERGMKMKVAVADKPASPAKPVVPPISAWPVRTPGPARSLTQSGQPTTPAIPLITPAPTRPSTLPVTTRPLTQMPHAGPITLPGPASLPTTGMAHHVSEKYLKHLEYLPHNPKFWTERDVAALVTRIAGTSAGTAVAAARMSGPELLMASRQELVECLHIPLGPVVKILSVVRHLRKRSLQCDANTP